MSKLNVKIMKKIILMSSVVGLLVLGINYTFFCPTIINEFIATKVYSEPANSYFDDENFYKCVVDAYNKENYTSLPYTTSLSDEKLQTITYLSCYNKSITSTKGIEKLTSLKTLDVYNNKLTNLDVSKNTSLKGLRAYNNKLTNLNISKNTALTFLYAYNNKLTNLDVSNNTSLTHLYVYNNKLTNLDVRNNINLIKLRANNNSLNKLDVSENEGLKILDISNNKLNEIDVSNNVLLEALLIDGNNLSYLDISNNNNLRADSGCYRDTEEALCINISKEKAIYKGETYQYEELIKYPASWNIDYSDHEYSGADKTTVVQSYEAIQEGISITPLTLDYIYIKRLNYLLNRRLITNTDINLYVIEATSDKYEINVEKGYINTVIDNDEDIILNNISLNYGDASIEDNKLLIKYNNELVKPFDIVGFSSEEYDLSNDYIYIGTDNLDLDKINVINGTKIVTDNKLQIKYGEDVLKEFKLVSISSDEYDLSKDYIYTSASVFNIDKINIINGTKVATDNKLQIKYGNNVIIKEYRLLSISFGELKLFEKSITTPKDTTYEDFVRNITVSDGLAYKIFKESVEVTTGNIEKDMILKVYYNNVEIDMFTITDEYLNIDESIKVDEVGKYFSNIDFNTSADSILSKIDTTGEVTIKNNKGEVITGTNLVGTGSTVTIKLSKETYNYTIIINGDIDGDGILKLSDIMKIANYTYKDKNSLSGAYVKAADFDNNGSTNLSDIMKSAKALYGSK